MRPRPCSRDRASPDAIHDAAVDFFLLPGTQMFVVGMWLIGERLPRRYQFPGVHP